MRHYHPTTTPAPRLFLFTHPPRHNPGDPKAESTWRNTSVPIGAAAPAPLLARPHNALPCAAPAARPGTAQGWGNNRQIFKTEPREQSRSLCTKQPGAGSCRRARKVLLPAHAPSGPAALGLPRVFHPGPRSFINPFPPPPGSAEREAGFHLLAVTRLIEKKK